MNAVDVALVSNVVDCVQVVGVDDVKVVNVAGAARCC